MSRTTMRWNKLFSFKYSALKEDFVEKFIYLFFLMYKEHVMLGTEIIVQHLTKQIWML